jgi:hypothetical protein
MAATIQKQVVQAFEICEGGGNCGVDRHRLRDDLRAEGTDNNEQ